MSFATIRTILTQLVDLAQGQKATINNLQVEKINLSTQLSTSAADNAGLSAQLAAALSNDAADAATIATANAATTTAQQAATLLQDAELQQQLETALAALAASTNA
jgi:hypothetical protein